MNAGLLLPIALIVVAFGVQFTIASTHDWRCGNCEHVFTISPFAACFLPHSFPMRKLATCPDCGERTWVSPVSKKAQS